jgi:hypothetical protein
MKNMFIGGAVLMTALVCSAVYCSYGLESEMNSKRHLSSCVGGLDEMDEAVLKAVKRQIVFEADGKSVNPSKNPGNPHLGVNIYSVDIHPRIWNNHLKRYACIESEDSECSETWDDELIAGHVRQDYDSIEDRTETYADDFASL